MTKAITALSVSSSIILQAAHAARRPVPAYVAAFEHAFVFRHPGELIFGAGLLYYSRLFERQVRRVPCPRALSVPFFSARLCSVL